MHPSRKTALLAVTLAAVFSLLMTDASARSARGIPCRPGKSKLIAADTQAVVYLGRVTEPSNRTTYPAYLGCLRGARRAYEVGGPGVGSSSVADGTRNLMVAGPIVVWEHWSSTGMGSPERNEWVVLVLNLRTGRILHKLPTGTATVREWTGVGPTTGIVVSPTGGLVAWIVRVVDEQGQHGYEVHATDITGTRILAMGTNIDPHSLALAGHTIYWTQGGKPSAAALI